MQTLTNISDLHSPAFGNTENGISWHSQSTDNQYLYFYQTLSDSTGFDREKDSLRLNLQSGELCRARLTSPLDLFTRFYYFGARYYDCDLSGLFLSVDPMSDKYPSLSPYNYCAWNPIKLVDPDGRDTINLADSKFLRTQPDISNALIINAHGRSFPPAIHNNNIDFIDIFSVKTSDCIYTSNLASYISGKNVYQENNRSNTITPIFLLACQTGECTIPYQSFAYGLEQAVPNSLVVAPVGDIHAKNGLMRLLPKEGGSYHCYWSVMYKGQDIGHIENYEAYNISTLLSSMQKKVEVYNAKHPDNQILLPELNLQ